MSTTAGKHAGGGAAHSQPEVPEPSYAERARTLVYLGRLGSLSTLSRKQAGFPFGSVMPYALDARGRPIFLISSMAMHTQNLQGDARASLLVTQTGASQQETGGDPLGSGRVTLVGNASPVPEPERGAARELYLARHANSKHWVDFEDFSFYRMDVADVYYVGGFGVMGWVDAAEYSRAEPDPLAEAASGIIQHLNGEHADALALLGRAFARLETQSAVATAVMTEVDRLGFHLRLQTEEGPRGARIAFPHEVRSVAEARTVFVEMTAQARGELQTPQ